jgi:hypothetical protein
MLINKELYSKYIQQQQQQPQPQQQPHNNNFADFQLFMQFMMYYQQLHGKDYILKIYNEDKDDDNNGHHKHHSSNHHHYDQWVQDWIKYQKEHPKNPKERDFLSPENVDKSITFIGENEPGFIKTPEQKRAEEQELIADMEDDLADANTSKEKKRIQGLIDMAKEEFDLDKDKEKLTGYDEEGRQLNVINGDYDEEPKQIEDWQNTGTTNEEQEVKYTDDGQIVTNFETNTNEEESHEDDEPDTSSEEATEQEEDNNQVNTDTEDSSDNTDSSDSQDSSDSEDNSSDDGGDSSDSGDDSSSSDDGGDSGDSSESEE